MRYADWGDVVARYGNTVASDAPTQEMQEGWVEGAEDYLDSALGVRYTVPFSAPIPGLVKDLTIDLTYWKMTVRQESSKELKKWIDQRIQQIINGEVVLVADGTIVGATGDKSAVGQGRKSSFGMDDPENWDIHPDVIEQAEGDRE